MIFAKNTKAFMGLHFLFRAECAGVNVDFLQIQTGNALDLAWLTTRRTGLSASVQQFGPADTQAVNTSLADCAAPMGRFSCFGYLTYQNRL